MVAAGLMTELALEGRHEETVRLAEFCCAVGLPAHLGHVSFDASKKKTIWLRSWQVRRGRGSWRTNRFR
jgi:glycerol dehydrogenase-like iron-containing ADH family enzyme